MFNPTPLPSTIRWYNNWPFFFDIAFQLLCEQAQHSHHALQLPMEVVGSGAPYKDRLMAARSLTILGVWLFNERIPDTLPVTLPAPNRSGEQVVAGTRFHLATEVITHPVVAEVQRFHTRPVASEDWGQRVWGLYYVSSGVGLYYVRFRFMFRFMFCILLHAR